MDLKERKFKRWWEIEMEEPCACSCIEACINGGTTTQYPSSRIDNSIRRSEGLRSRRRGSVGQANMEISKERHVRIRERNAASF